MNPSLNHESLLSDLRPITVSQPNLSSQDYFREDVVEDGAGEDDMKSYIGSSIREKSGIYF